MQDPNGGISWDQGIILMHKDSGWWGLKVRGMIVNPVQTEVRDNTQLNLCRILMPVLP